MIFVMVLLSACDNNTAFLKEMITLPYPSGSAIEYYHGKLYVVGDDANVMLVLDSNFQKIDSIQLFNNTERRIPKETKADIESIGISRWKGLPHLLLAGSGSLKPYRDSALLLNLQTKEILRVSLDTLYNRFHSGDISEINIEGNAVLSNYQLFTNRGNKSSPKNHLIWVRHPLINNQENNSIRFSRLGPVQDTNQFAGASGLGYARKSDKLIVTLSTEDTRNAYDDGAIGKSYLWIINNISGKARWNAINPDRIIDLEKIDNRFRGQKIESVSVLNETNHFIQLVLIADNDDGRTTLFRLDISKK